MESPLISVIVPVYNKSKYVGKLIDCIKKQSFGNYECIIVDDGSTDSSARICECFLQNNHRFAIVHIPNGGVSHARNTALSIAKGKYITFVDADDEIPVDYLETIASDIELSKADMVIGSLKKRVDESKSRSEIIKHPFESRTYAIEELLPQFAEAQKNSGIFGWCVNKTFRREFVAKAHFDESLTLYEDFDFYLEVYPQMQTVYFDNSLLYAYLSARGGLSRLKATQIDYLAQARVNIRYKHFLEGKGAWKGSNKVIVSDAIQRFIFFAVFHSSMESFDRTFESASSLMRESRISIRNADVFMYLILCCLFFRRSDLAKLLVLCYRGVRKLVRRLPAEI